MSYRQCVFLVPFEFTDQTRLLERVWRGLGDLDGSPPPLYALICDAATAERTGAWQLILATSDDSDRYLNRGFIVDSLRPLPLTVVLHDDSTGTYLIQHDHPDDHFRIGSSGAHLEGNVERITGPYPQRGLDAAAAAELQVWSNAVGLGLREVYAGPIQYLDLLYAKTAWQLMDPHRPVSRPTKVKASSLRNYVASWPEDDGDLQRGYPPMTPDWSAGRWIALAEDEHVDPALRMRAALTALERAPSSAKVATGAAEALFELERWPEAAAAFGRAYQLDPADSHALYNRVCAHARGGEREALLVDLRRIVAAHPAERADLAEDDDLATFRRDREVAALLREPPDPAVALIARIRAIDWRGHMMRTGSRIALVNEFLRRTALWSAALGCPERWPFFDVAGAAVDEPPGEVDPGELGLAAAVDALVTMTLCWAVRWARLTVSPRPALPDPFEPLLRCYERGGGLRVENKLIQVDIAAVPYRVHETSAQRDPLVVEDAVLDAMDA